MGDIAVLYVTGLGKTVFDLRSRRAANYTSLLADLADLQITLGGVTIVPTTICPSQTGPPGPCIQYAGLTPLEAALYQINVTLPAGIGTNPVIQVSLGEPVQPRRSPVGCPMTVPASRREIPMATFLSWQTLHWLGRAPGAAHVEI